MVDKPKKRQRETVEVFAEIDRRNRSGLGWKPEDFGIYTLINAAQGVGANALQFQPGSVAGQAVSGSDPQAINNPALTQGRFNNAVIPKNTPSSAVLTPQQQEQVRGFIKDPQQIAAGSGPVDRVKSFLANLFDTSDTFDPTKSTAIMGYMGADSAPEAIWDSFWAGLGWGYDKLTQVTAAGLSGLPGGIDTLTWDEAADVSVGQVFVGSIGESVGKLRRGEGSMGDVFAAVATPLNWLAAAGANMSPDSPIQQEGWDITNPEDRKVFEQGAEKFFSGVTDFGFVFADPLILGGAATRIGRLKWVDRPMDTVEARAQLKQELDLGATIVNEGTAGTRPLSPSASFIDWTTRKNADGVKERTQEEIFNHPMVRYAAKREELASALYAADDYETAALLFRYAKGDTEAGAQLFEKRADIVDAMARSERERLSVIAALNPDQVQRVQSIAEKAANKANDRVLALEKAGRKGSDEWSLAVRFRDNANQNYVDVTNGNFDLVTMATPEGVAAAKKIFNDLVRSDRALQKALGDEADRIGGIWGSMSRRGGTKGVPADNAFGRAVERSRQRRATAAYQAAATRGRLVQTGKTIVRDDGSTAVELKSAGRTPFSRTFWEKDEFGIGGFRRGVRLWRWMGEENPAGYVTTRGIGAQESYREVRAVLNDVEIYSGPARSITLDDGTVIQVGGLEKKQQYLQMYMDAVNDTVEGSNAAALALDRIENLMFNDIMAWHGIPESQAQEVLRKARQVRDDTMDSLRDPERRFYVDQDGNFDALPWLEQHLQNGTYMLNYRALEKAARLYDEQGLARFVDESGQYISQNFMRAYGVFNDFWRPSVLLRLGYTMRNVVEGQFRAAAFTGSVDPLRYGVENGLYSIRNRAVSFRGSKKIQQAVNAARLRQAGNANVPMPKRYQKWLENQIIARETETDRIVGVIDNAGRELAEMNSAYRDAYADFLSRRSDSIQEQITAARANGANADELGALQAELDDVNRLWVDISNITDFRGANEASETAFDQLRAHIRLYDDSVARRQALDDENIAVALYAQQGSAKRRVFSKAKPGPDGRVLQQAFDPDSPFTPVSLSLLSADSTQQSMLQLSMNLGENLFKAIRQETYQNVTPGMPKYFEGYANVLRDIKSSGIGSRIIEGKTDDEIVDFLMGEREGREIMDFLMAGKKFDRDDAFEKVATVRERYEQLTPSATLKEFMRTSTPENGAALEALVGAKNATGEFIEDLPNVIGNIAEEVGAKRPMDTWRSITSTGMKILGSMPEDILVRQPFYGTRFNQVVTGLYADLREQVGEISMRELNEIYRLAHAQSLKDTKDWLYTIERRTNLGTYGEVLVPFISAAQNSTTTVGRLIWNRPETAVLLAAMWRAPNAAGFEDEDGNIVIPIPHDFIPDAVERAFGLDAMENWKIRKSSLNVIVPESGFGFIPRPGPIVAAPASEIMKYGLFGVSVESPEYLHQFFGKEGSDQMWTVFKNYLFGEGQGVAPDTLSLSMLSPPVAQRAIQFIRGTDNAQFAYQYNLIYRTEMLNWMGGYRDDMPDRDEIMAKTRGFTIARMLANILAFTPPAYESKIDPLIQAIRKIEREDPENASRIIYQQYGPFLQMIGDFSNSRNYSGMGPYTDSVRIARKHSDLINQVSPGLERLGDLSVLSMLTMGATAGALYDDSAYGWQFANNIPGVNVKFRDLQQPEQSWAQSRVNTGWTAYIAKLDELEARLKERGLNSFRQAPDLKAERDQFLAGMAGNPLFKEWWQDYKEFGSSRTLAGISTMQAALANESFMKEYGNTPIWSNAQQYLYHRQIVMDALASREGGINNTDNEDIREYWDDARAFLKQDPEWTSFANRFLNGDDDPQDPGVQIATYYEQPAIGGE